MLLTPKRVGMFLGLAAVLALAFYTGLLRFNYPSRRAFPVRGIDVSHHQGHISWFEASLHDVQFAYLKASEGSDFRDRKFLYNWTQSETSGIPRGAYHFFSFCSPGGRQARNFLNTVPAGPSQLPPGVDLEFSGNCGRVPSRAELARELSAYSKVLATRDARTPVYYVTPDFYKRYFKGDRSDYPPHRLWIRNVLQEPPGTPCSEWVFWQYADRGRIPGIKGPVDLNVFCGGAEKFAEFISSNTERRHSGTSALQNIGTPERQR